MTSRNKNSYEKLRDEWYEKLKKEGFVDIEAYSTSGSNGPKGPSSNFNRPRMRLSREDKIAYTEMATTFLHEFAFQEELHKVIWEYHVNGLYAIDIVKTLHKVNIVLCKSEVQDLVRLLRKTMMKMYV